METLIISGQRPSCTVSDSMSSSRSSTSSKISMDHVNQVLNRLRKKQVRESTANNYICAWRHLNKFIIGLDYRGYLSWEEKTALFGAFLVDGGVQSSTLKSYFSAIKYILNRMVMHGMKIKPC